MQLASIILMEKKKVDQFIIPPTYFKRAITLSLKVQKLNRKLLINPIAAATQEKNQKL
jgi:hypothetical protein